MRFLFPLSLLVVTSLSFPALAQGVDVGKPIPAAISLPDQNGKTRTLDSLMGKSGMTLVFLRSTLWSQPCQTQATDLSAAAKEFDKMGYPIVTLSYDSAEDLKAFADSRKISKITLLSDPRSETIRALSVLNDGVAKGTMAYGTAKPGVMIIGKDKLVKAKLFKEKLLERASVAEIKALIPAAIAAEKKVQDNKNYVIDPLAKSAPPEDTAPNETLEPVAAPISTEIPVAPAAPEIIAPVVETPAPADITPPVVPTPDAVMAPTVPVPDLPEAPVVAPVVPASEGAENSGAL